MPQDVIREVQDLRYLKWSHIRQSSGTAGSFLKAYGTVNGVKTYFKLSSYNPVQGITGHESVNELIVDRLLTILSVDHLHYQLINALVNVDGKDYNTWLCSSQNFRQSGESKIAFDDFYELNRYAGETMLDFCSRFGWEKYFYTMLVVDYLIINRDRHGANIEILKNARTGALRPAPLFDHGLSLICRCESELQAEQFDPLADHRVQSFIGTNSTAKNLKLIPPDCKPSLRRLEERDHTILFEDLNGVIPEAYLDKIWSIIWERWKCYENMQNN